MRTASIDRKMLFSRSAVSVVILLGSILCSSAKTVEHKLGEALAKDGLFVGYNPSCSTLVVQASETVERLSAAETSWWLLQRRVLSFKAEMTARQALIKALRTQFAVDGTSTLTLSDKTGENAMSAKTELSAVKALRRTSVVEMVDDVSPTQYSVAVAVAYSLNDERGWIAPSTGRTGDENADEWKSWMQRQDVFMLSGCRQFCDREGCVRTAGIGFALAAKNRNWMIERARSEARANLAFGLSVVTMSGELAQSVLREIFDDNHEDESYEKNFLSLVKEESHIPTLLAPEVYSTMVLHPVTKQELYVSVCGYEPAELDRLLEMHNVGNRNADCLGGVWTIPSRKSTCAGNLGTKPRLIKVFNPATGKYEEVCK